MTSFSPSITLFGSIMEGMNGTNLILLCSVIALAVVVLILRHEWDWATPARRLGKMLDEIRAGKIPIDSIADCETRGLQPLAIQIEELLRELRLREMKIAELNVEMS